MHSRGRLALLLALPCAACLLTNPSFDGDDGAASDSGGGTAASTGGAVTGATMTTSGSGSAGASTGGSAGGSTGDTTEPAASATGGAGTDATTGEPASTGEPAPTQELLKHYADLAQCDYPHWCAYDGNINDPATAENWDAECFDSPLAPPFTVDRVGFQVYGRRNSPAAALEFHEYDAGAQAPKSSPFATVALGVIDTVGYLDFPLAPPVEIPFQRFCISVHSGTANGSQLGVASDDVVVPAGQAFFGMKGPEGCNFPKFTDIAYTQFSVKTQWCIDATISKP